MLRGGRNHGFAISAASLRHSSLSCSSFETSTTGTDPAHADKRYKNREIQIFWTHLMFFMKMLDASTPRQIVIGW